MNECNGTHVKKRFCLPLCTSLPSSSLCQHLPPCQSLSFHKTSVHDLSPSPFTITTLNLPPHWLMQGLQLSRHHRSCFPHCQSFISLLTTYVWILTSMKARTILVLPHNVSNPNPALKAAGLGNSVDPEACAL